MWAALVLLASGVCGFPADITIDISTVGSDTVRMPRGFSGFNAPQLRTAVEYLDPNFISAAAALKPGWIRFPAGAASSAYDWATGYLNSSWVGVFSDIPPHFALLTNAEQLTQAKGGVRFSDFGVFANTLGARSIICFNTFTDNDPSSATNMVLAAQSLQLKVVAWELGNEPFFFTPKIFSSATAYATAVQNPYFNDIISVNPNAVVSMPFAGQFPGLAWDFTSWDQELASYQPRFWNAVATHIYPLLDTSLPVVDTQAFLNGVLAHGSTEYVNSYLLPLIGNSTPIYITEFNCAVDRTFAFQTYLYNGIFLVEYITRLSSHPNVRRVGVHALYMGKTYLSGMIQAGRDFEQLLLRYVYPNSVNTAGWPFDFFTTAPGLALAVANEAINKSWFYYRTSATGGVTVPITGYDGLPIPAVFAQAYKGDNRKNYLVITNKSSVSQSAVIRVNGADVTALFSRFYVANNDPTAANTSNNPRNVQIISDATANPVMIPAYSVMRLEW